MDRRRWGLAVVSKSSDPVQYYWNAIDFAFNIEEQACDDSEGVFFRLAGGIGIRPTVQATGGALRENVCFPGGRPIGHWRKTAVPKPRGGPINDGRLRRADFVKRFYRG